MEHLEVLRRLRSAGYRVITADSDASAPAHARSDLAIYSSDEQAIAAVAEREKVCGVLAPFSNADGPMAARLSARLQAPSLPESVAQILASRNRFREIVIELALPHPQTHVVTRDTELPATVMAAHKWVLRPDRSTGRGAELITAPEEAEAAIDRVLSESSSEVALLERYIEGQHSLCAAAVRDGKVVRGWFIDRVIGEGLETVGLRLPSRLSHHLRKQSLQLIEQIVGSLKIASAMLLAEVVTAESKVYLLDLAPRLPANGGVELVKQGAGADLAVLAGALACGDELPELPDRNEKAWGVVLLAPWSSGRLDFDSAAAEKLCEQSWVHGLSWFVPRGALIAQGRGPIAAAGRVYITGRDRDAVDARAVEVSKRLRVRVV